MPTYDPNKQTAGPLITATNAQGYSTGGYMANPAYAAQGGAPIAAFNSATGATLGGGAPLTTQQQMSIGPANGSIKTQADVNSGNSNSTTPAQAYGFSNGVYDDPALIDARRQQAEAARIASSTPVDEGAIRTQTLANFQAEIDSQNQIYADKLRTAQVAGEGRLGSSGAIQARRGLLGSDFGAAQTDTVNAANNDVYAGINAEKGAALAMIQAKIRSAVADEISAKTKAKSEGLDSYVKYLGEGQTRKQENAVKAAQLLLEQKHTMNDLHAEDLKSLLDGYGVTKDQVANEYNKLKNAKDTAEATAKDAASKAQLAGDLTRAQITKIDADIASGKLIKIGEGDMLYDPSTGKTFKNPKTFAPTGSTPTGTSGGTGGTGGPDLSGISGEAQEWVNAINNGSVSLDEALTKIGATAASRQLKSEIVAGINAQGGQTEGKITQLKNNISVINDLLSGDSEYFGASIAPRFESVNPFYSSYKAKLDQLVASLSIENLPLLKGPLSDRDIEFVKQLSSGLNMNMDEATAISRLKQIKERLQEKVDKTKVGSTVGEQFAEKNTQSSQVVYQGKTYNVDANGDMTPA